MKTIRYPIQNKIKSGKVNVIITTPLIFLETTWTGLLKCVTKVSEKPTNAITLPKLKYKNTNKLRPYHCQVNRYWRPLIN